MRKIQVLLLLAFLFRGEHTLGQDVAPSHPTDSLVTRQYTIAYGSRPNMEAGALSTLSVTSLAFDQVSNLIRKSRFDNGWTRAANVAFIQLYLGLTAYGALPHEYFGHYSRAKEFGVTPKLSSDFPSIGGDDVFKVKHQMSALHRQMIVAAGPEFTTTVTREAIKQMYSEPTAPSYIGNYLAVGKIVDGLMYTQNNLKPFLKDPEQYYQDNEDYFKRNPVPNDPLSFALALTESYGYYDDFVPKDATWLYRPANLSLYVNDFLKDQHRRMKRAQILTLLDPALLSFLYGNYQYLVNGKPFFKPLMLRVGGVRMMPSIRANLGELGAENYYDLYLLTPRSQAVLLYYRQGGNLNDQLFGGGAEINNLSLGPSIRLSTQLDYWRNGRIKDNGVNVMETVRYGISNRFFLTASGGYKTKGGLIGKQYGGGFYGHAGLGVNLSYRGND